MLKVTGKVEGNYNINYYKMEYFGKKHTFTSREKVGVITLCAGKNESLFIEGASLSGSSDIITIRTTTELNHKKIDNTTHDVITVTSPVGTSLKVGTSLQMYDLETEPDNAIMMFSSNYVDPSDSKIYNQINIWKRVASVWAEEAKISSNISFLDTGFGLTGAVDSYSGKYFMLTAESGLDDKVLIYKNVAGNYVAYCELNGPIKGYMLRKTKIYDRYIVGTDSDGVLTVLFDNGVTFSEFSSVSNCSLFDLHSGILAYCSQITGQIYLQDVSTGANTQSLTKLASDTDVLGLSIRSKVLVFYTQTKIYVCDKSGALFKISKIFNNVAGPIGCSIASNSFFCVYTSTNVYYFVKNLDTWDSYALEAQTNFESMSLSSSGIAISRPTFNSSAGKVDYYQLKVPNPSENVTTSVFDSTDRLIVGSRYPFLFNNDVVMLSSLSVAGNIVGDQRFKGLVFTSTTLQSIPKDTFTQLQTAFTNATGIFNDSFELIGGSIKTLETGIYQVSVRIVFAFNNTQYRTLLLKKNGSTIDEISQDAEATSATTLSISRIMNLQANDLLTLFVKQASTESINIVYCYVSVVKIGV